MFKALKVGTIFLIILVTLAALNSWPGSPFFYLVFSASFITLAGFAFKKRISAGFVIFSGAMFIGYWLKLSVHTIWPNMPWMEPIGYFSASGSAWDDVALVASLSAISVLLAGISVQKIDFRFEKAIPIFLGRAPFIMWCIGLAALAIVVGLNEKFSISHVPISPRKLDIPWPLQGLFNWFLATGALIFLFIPFYMDAIKNRIVLSTFLFVVACVAVSVSLYSRGIVVYGSLILLAGIFVYRDRLPSLTKVALTTIFLMIAVGTISSIVLSQERRETFNESRFSQSSDGNSFLSEHSLYLILKLPLERWVGLEGVMSVSAYPEKGWQLLRTAVSERRSVGPVDMYTSEIALSPVTDTKVAMYATPPGIVAFLLYADNLAVVFLGVFLFTLLMIFAEYLVMHFSSNIFLASAMGTAGAMQLIHTGSGGLLVPAQMLLTTLMFCITIGLFSRKFLTK